jgi:hypothetical protein
MERGLRRDWHVFIVITSVEVVRRIFIFETSDLCGASLDKAGSGHPLKRVGII